MAGVVRGAEGFVCAACGGPRAATEGTLVLENKPIVGARGKAIGLRLFGALALGVGVLAAAGIATLVSGGTGLALAVVIGGSAVGIGAWALRAAARFAGASDRGSRASRELALLALAAEHGGDLTATLAARSLGWGLADADAALSAMADGSRVVVLVDTDGVVHYVFQELQAASGAPRMRVDASLASEEALLEAETASAERLERKN